MNIDARAKEVKNKLKEAEDLELLLTSFTDDFPNVAY